MGNLQVRVTRGNFENLCVCEIEKVKEWILHKFAGMIESTRELDKIQ